MRLLFLSILVFAPIASATVTKSADVVALSNVMSAVRYHMKEKDCDYPSSWQEVRSQVPGAAEILDKFSRYRIEDRYEWVPGKMMIRQYPDPKRLIVYSRWLEITGPWNDERIQRRIVLANEEGDTIMPSHPDTDVRALVAASGHDPNALFGADTVYVPNRGLLSFPGARKKAIVATSAIAIGGLLLWIRAKRRRLTRC